MTAEFSASCEIVRFQGTVETFLLVDSGQLDATVQDLPPLIFYLDRLKRYPRAEIVDASGSARLLRVLRETRGRLADRKCDAALRKLFDDGTLRQNLRKVRPVERGAGASAAGLETLASGDATLEARRAYANPGGDCRCSLCGRSHGRVGVLVDAACGRHRFGHRPGAALGRPPFWAERSGADVRRPAASGADDALRRDHPWDAARISAVRRLFRASRRAA